MTVSAQTSMLFQPIALGGVPLANRIVMAPMTRNRATDGNVPSELALEYYRQRASAGLIITEGSQIVPEGQGYPLTPGIHSEAQVAGWRRITDAVHREGGRIALQLWHVGRISHPTLQPNGQLPVAPSAIAAEGTLYTGKGMEPFVTPRALETAEIPGIIRDFASAARRAIEAGFDLVEIHAANGYLIDQFLRDGTNHRTDAYGGSLVNRIRFLVEVTSAIVAAVGAHRVGVRLSPFNSYNSMHDSDPATTFTHAAAALRRFGLAYLHVIEPVGPTWRGDVSDAPRLTPKLRAAFGGMVIANGGYDRERAERMLEAGEADLVSFGVPFLANPDLPERLRSGAPLNEPDRATFYGGTEKGYTDYPALAEVV